jgi:purine-binding chemotaxis protein CheW
MSQNNQKRSESSLDEEFLDDEEDTMEGVYLTFAIDSRICGLEVQDVIEIVGLPPITEVPDMPDFVRGIINLRGKVIPVMEMRRRFLMIDRPHDDRTCVIIVNLHDRLTGLIVDQVREVVKIREEDLEGSPRVGDGAGSRFIKKVGKIGSVVVLVLALDRLLNDREVERFSEQVVGV